MDTNLVSKNLNRDLFENKLKKFKNLKRKKKKKEISSSSTFKSVKSPASGKENVWFLDSLDFEILLDFRFGRDVL